MKAVRGYDRTQRGLMESKVMDRLTRSPVQVKWLYVERNKRRVGKAEREKVDDCPGLQRV